MKRLLLFSFVSAMMGISVGHSAQDTFSEPMTSSRGLHIKSDYCLCRGGQNFMASPSSSCALTCANASIANSPFTILLGQISGPFEGELLRFCHGLDNEHLMNPRCYGKVFKYGQNDPGLNPGLDINEISITEDNRFRVLFTNQLQQGVAYHFYIQSRKTYIDPKTGWAHKIVLNTDSIPFQVLQNFGGPLKVASINRYKCLFADEFRVYQNHYLFDKANDPPLVPSYMSSSITCHNGTPWTPDAPFLPRLGEEKAFHLWSNTDHRFYPGKGDSEMAINKYVRIRLQEKHGVLMGPESEAFFQPFVLSGSPIPSNSSSTLLGVTLKAFKDSNGDRLVCPGQIDLNEHPGSEKFNPLFNVLGEFIGETEGLYAALRVPRQFSPLTHNPHDDILFINEGLLKNIWFYRKDDSTLAFLDTYSDDFEELVNTETIYFYWPANELAPTVKRPIQGLYKVRTLEEIAVEISGQTPPMFSLPPFDRRLGCIPKMH